MADQRARTGEISNVSVLLVREHRVGGQTQLLRALDLAVPVRALDQTHHELQIVRAGNARHFIDDLQRARLIRLDRQAEAAPAWMLLGDVRGELFEDIEREFEPVALFGVDRQVHVGARSGVDQRRDARHEFGEDTFALRVFVAREQRAQLDRDAVGVFGPVAARAFGDGGNRVLVRRQITLRVALGACAFAEHVVGEAQRRLRAAR